jgi:mRNA interferase RelE/StbE
LAWRIEFDDAAKKELGRLAKRDRQTAQRITKFLRERVAVLEDPRSIGEALKGSALGEFWKYRVGAHRIIASIEDEAVRILVLRIGDRKEVYRKR